MELTREVMRTAQPFLKHQKHAPREVLAAMVSLTPPEDITAHLVWSGFAPGTGTAWRVLWLTNTTLTYCEATHPLDENWNVDSAPLDGSTEVDISVRVIRLDRISCLRVVGVMSGPRQAVLQVQIKREIEVPGLPAIPLPLSGGFPDWHDDGQCQEFMTQLRASIDRHG